MQEEFEDELSIHGNAFIKDGKLTRRDNPLCYESMTTEEIIESIEKLDGREANYVIFELMSRGKISFHEVAEIHVKVLEYKKREFYTYATRAAVAIESFRPGGLLKAKFDPRKVKQVDIDGFRVKALLFLQKFPIFGKEKVEEELAEIDKSIVSDEKEKIEYEINYY